MTRSLVVGANTGYGAALVARMGGVVTALESDAGLADAARAALAGLSLPVGGDRGPRRGLCAQRAVQGDPDRGRRRGNSRRASFSN